MSSDQFSHIEQDQSSPKGGNELPTYDDLATQQGPNSRFGRWRGWIEKRAAERYLDMTPEERARRRERGWGNEEDENEPELEEGRMSLPDPINLQDSPTPTPASLHIQTSGLDLHSPLSSQPIPPRPPSPPLPPIPSLTQNFFPTHLKMVQFGSRFLPHTTSPIHCLLPVLADGLLLIGHDDGLSVLEMFPKEWTENGEISIKGPDEAQSRLIWRGEGVYQMSVLESEMLGEGTPQGVVLLLVGPESTSPTGKEQESFRTLRMYNLASLISLAKWAVAQKGASPLNLERPSTWNAQQTPVKKHRHTSSITRGLKSLIEPPATYQTSEPLQSLHSLNISTPSPNSARSLTPNRKDSDDSGWDVVDDLPLRWATDFVPLAAAGSRLCNTSVLSYALWRNDENRKGKGGQLLAIATKNSILLYETPKGERAFRFVKEFYTPLHPRKIAFFQQSLQDVVRTPSTVGTPGRYHSHNRTDSIDPLRGGNRSSSLVSTTLNYGTQLSIFVIFDKKAGWIRLADSAVGEMNLYDDGTTSHNQQHNRQNSMSPGPAHNTIRKSRISFDDGGGQGKWVPPTRCELPIPASLDRPASTRMFYIATRGKKTHILRYPVPTNSSAHPPFRVVTWHYTPNHISARVCDPSFSPDAADVQPYLQLTALGEDGVEVQEIPLSFLGKGKGKAGMEVSIRAEKDLGGDTGFLCVGGHWDQPLNHNPIQSAALLRAPSNASAMSAKSYDSMETIDMVAKMKKEEGIYGWCRKGAQDWRVFWVGGSMTDMDSEEDSL